MKRSRILIPVFILAILFAVAAWQIANAQNHLLNNDFFTFWLGGKMVGQCQNPYDPMLWKSGHELAGSTWLENPIYCYPFPLAYLTVLIGILPIQLAGPIWLFLSMSSITWSIFIGQSRRKEGLRLNQLFPVILGLAFFRPVLTTIRNGQIGGFFLLALMAALFFAEKKRWIIVGLLLTLLYLKPTLGLPILGLLFIWLYKNNGLKGILANLLTAVCVLVISVIHQPGWVSAFFSVGLGKGSNVFMVTPTIWGAAGKLCGLNSNCTMIAGAVLFTLITLTCVALFWKFSKRMNIWLAGSAAVLTALLVTPYLWAYDQVLLILPILYITNGLASIKTRYIVFSLVPLLFTMISLLLVFIAMLDGHDVGSLLLTMITAILLIWTQIRIRKHENGPIAS